MSGKGGARQKIPIYLLYKQPRLLAETARYENCFLSDPAAFYSLIKRKRTFTFGHCTHHLTNIARGTTDPDIDSVTWIKFSNNMSTLALVPNLATRWRHLHELQL